MSVTANDLSRLKGLKILLAEDNVTNQLVATQMLENLGASVDVAADGAIALERLQQNNYDVLLVDIEMPRVSGLDVIRTVRASDDDVSEAPVIALTAYAMQEHRDKIRQAGADGLIPKPIISIEQFGIDILTYIDENRLQRRANSAPVASEPDAGRPIDDNIFDSLSQSIGEEAMVDLLEKIEVDLETVRRQIVDAEASADAKAMRAATHVLISVAGAVGGVKLQSRAEHLNAMAHRGDQERISADAESTLADLDEVLDFVRLKIGSSPT